MTIDVGVEVDALFLDLPESGEGKYLKSAGIGEDRTVPVHKPVEAAELLDLLVAGPDMKMVGVGKLHLCPDPAKVIGGHSALDRGDSSYIHEYRRVDRAVDCLYVSPLMAGIVCGTYSSVCLTGAMWYVMTTKKQKKDAVEKQAKKDAEKAAKEAKKSGK